LANGLLYDALGKGAPELFWKGLGRSGGLNGYFIGLAAYDPNVFYLYCFCGGDGTCPGLLIVKVAEPVADYCWEAFGLTSLITNAPPLLLSY